jgi:hypothetical protein
MSACDHCLFGDSDDGHNLDDEGYDPTGECFHIDQEDHDGDNHLGMPRNNDAPAPASRVEIPRELAEARAPAGGQGTRLEQLREMQAKLDEETGRLMQLRQNLKQEWVGRALTGGARHRARDVQRRIIDDARAGLPLTFNGASQNLAAAAILLRTMPEPPTTEGRRVQGELKGLLENAAVQQAESFASRRRGCPLEHHAASSRHIREASVHTEHTGSRTPVALDRLGNEQHRRDRRARLEERVHRGYHPRRGGRYDSEEDRSPSPEPPDPRVFSRAIRRASFPARFREASGRIAKWAVKLMGETLSFAPRKAIKSQVLADFLAEWTDTQLPTAPIQAELWTMYFDGSLMKTGAGASLLFISPLGEHVRYVIRLHFPASNNVAEYEALVNGLASPSS